MRDKSDMGTTETYPESCPLNPTTGGAYDSSRFGTGVIDPNLSPTNRASTSSGTGIHAQQYRGRAGEYGQGTTTTTTTISSGTTPGVGHHVSHHHHQGHGYAPGDTSTGLLKFVAERNRPIDIFIGQTGTGVGMGSTYGTTGMAGTQGTTGTTAGREMGVGQEQQSFEQGAMQHGKPSVMDKIIGMFW
jgi:hypothetical protein